MTDADEKEVVGAGPAFGEKGLICRNKASSAFDPIEEARDIEGDGNNGLDDEFEFGDCGN